MTHHHGPLTPADLFPAGPLHRLGHAAACYKTLDSTNALLLRTAATAGDGAVAWAEHQTAGRGRLGRRWESPRGAALMLSVLLHEPADSPALTLGALLACVAACEAVEATTTCTPAVRWPNDLAVGGRKLGGVLAETCALPVPGKRALVLGIGVNCLQHAGHFDGALAARATSLEMECPHPVDRAAAAAALLARLDAWLAQLGPRPADWNALRQAWHARCGDFGQRVRLEHDGAQYDGTALEVSAEGDLIVQLDSGSRRHFAAANTTRCW